MRKRTMIVRSVVGAAAAVFVAAGSVEGQSAAEALSEISEQVGDQIYFNDHGEEDRQDLYVINDDDDVVLFFRCEGDDRKIYAGAPLEDWEGHDLRVHYWFDDGEGETRHWSGSDDESALQATEEEHNRIVEQARTSDQLALTIFDEDGEPHTHVFRLEDFGAGIERMRCF